jgi:hypothetical protein
MTEAEWLICNRPLAMLELLWNRGELPKRKLVLLVCGFYRQVWDFLPDSASQQVVEDCERFADGIDNQYLFPIHARSFRAAKASRTAEVVSAVIHPCRFSVRNREPNDAELLAQADLIREVFPYRHNAVDPAWLTPTVTKLAQAIYNERVFDRMPILADALEDVGCSNQVILSHCRSGEEHVRGCWVVDLLTGKE